MKQPVMLYTNGCPRCAMLKVKLIQKDIPFVVNESVGDLENLGFATVPVLKVDDQFMDFSTAIKWVNSQ